MKKFILKPAIATIVMGIVAYFTYLFLIPKMGEKVALILTLIIAIIAYILLIIILRVFSKEEIYMIPFGKKLYNNPFYKKYFL